MGERSGRRGLRVLCFVVLLGALSLLSTLSMQHPRAPLPAALTTPTPPPLPVAANWDVSAATLEAAVARKSREYPAVTAETKASVAKVESKADARARAIARWREKQQAASGRRQAKAPTKAPAASAAALRARGNASTGAALDVSTARLARMDLEDGVRLGSLCGGATASNGGGCPVADYVVEELKAAESMAGQSTPAAHLCLFTSLTDTYIEGHLVFMRSVLRHTPSFAARAPPLYVLEQGLSADARRRVEAAYAHTRFVTPERGGKDVKVVTKFAVRQ